MKTLKFILFLIAIAAFVCFGLLIDKVFGKGAFDILCEYTMLTGLVLFVGSFILLPVFVIPLSKIILGPELDSFATQERVMIWLALAQLFRFEVQTDEELQEIARKLYDAKADRKLVTKIMAVEIAPICIPKSLSVGDDHYDGIDAWTESKDWLAQKVLTWRKAIRFAFYIPIFGMLLSLGIKIFYRRKLNLVLNQLDVLYAAESLNQNN